jgi:hypothetical protein
MYLRPAALLAHLDNPAANKLVDLMNMAQSAVCSILP